MARDKLILRWGDEFNPEKRAGQPRKLRDGRRMVHVWLTYEFFKSYVDEKTLEKMKHRRLVRWNRGTTSVLVERPRSLYYCDGVFYRMKSNRNPRHEGDAYLYEPFEGTAWTCFPKYQQKRGLPDCEIVCVAGHPVSVRIGQDAFSVTRDEWPTMESFLGLDESYKPEKYRPKRVA